MKYGTSGDMAPITNALRITGSRSNGKRPAGSTAATWLTVNGTGPWYVRPAKMKPVS